MSTLTEETFSKPLVKPLLRGHFHQAAFFFTLGACAMLLARAHDEKTFIAALIYSLSLTGLFGISTLYHRPNWNPTQRMWMRRLDHAAIFGYHEIFHLLVIFGALFHFLAVAPLIH